ncbi:MAG: hypothetical protein Q8O55_12250 [Dehalococcoidales bacterium]|nr:hypothetical protein [Dehalococcoidales bacterium]
MPQRDRLLLITMGGVFILLGLGIIIWDKKEEKNYYDSLSVSTRSDVREFLEHWPPRPQFGALRIGGWIAIAIGLVMIVVGGIFWLLG